MHIQSSSIIKSLFKHFQGHLDIFRDIDGYSGTPADAKLGKRGGLTCCF